MPRYAAFLRGMNLGGRRISNADLGAHVAALGFEDVATFRASGNVILSSDAKAAAVAQTLEQGLRAALGYAVPIYLRDGAEVRAIAELEPFDATVVAASKGKLQVMLLAERPAKATRERLLAMATEEDRLRVEGREVYWLPSGGLLESPLDLRAIAKLVGPTTMRTKGTIDLIAAKHFGDG